MAEKKVKILMVEDETDLAEVYSLQMKMSGIDVTIARNGADALSFIQKQKFDLVLLDLFMPDMDGFEVLQKLTADPKIKKQTIYAWSNLTQKKQIDYAIKCGATDFLIKSDYTPKTLVEKVMELINKNK
ncbi:MAG: response regulator [Candidatus Buchananbacteria bacterium]